MKERILIILIGICTIGIISGCAPTKQYVDLPNQTKSIEDSSKGRIYVLRPGSFGGALKMRVRDGIQKIGDLGPNSFLCWEHLPGKTTVFLDYELKYANTVIEMPEELEVEAGKVYYLKAELLPMKGGFSEDTNQLDRLSRLDNSEGERILKKLDEPPIGTLKAK